jgi:hypothetical protein
LLACEEWGGHGSTHSIPQNKQKKLESEMVMDHIIVPTKHLRSALYDECQESGTVGVHMDIVLIFLVVGFLPIFSHLDQLRLHS